MRKLIAGKLSKGDKLAAVDHASIQYPPFRQALRAALAGRACFVFGELLR